MVSDRHLQATKGQTPVLLSVQALLNCGVGNCEKGGNPHDALVFLQKYGLPEEGCQTYMGKSPQK